MSRVALAAALFDLDGTLIDSVDAHAQAWREALARVGLDRDLALIRAQIGKGGDRLVAALVDPATLASVGGEERLAALRKRIFLDRWLTRVRPFPGARELILRLRDDGVEIALATSAEQDELARLQAQAGIDDLLPVATTADDVAATKPEPDAFATALARLGLDDPARAVAIGDSPWDGLAASRLGLRCVGVRCGGSSDSDLREVGISEIYDDPADLLAHYDAVFG